MSQGMHSRPSAANRALRITCAITSSVMIAAAAGFTAVAMPYTEFIDDGVQTESATSQQVSPKQLMMYCPAQMQLADTGSYGDSQFQATSGDMQSSARYAAFGSVYSSQAAPLSEDGTDLVSLSTSGDGVEAMPFVGSSTASSSIVQSTRLLESNDGTGSASSMMSWATTGDLRGVSAASCITPSLDQSFVLGNTQTGTTQQLIVANLSSKATSIIIRAWGTNESGELNLSTNATISVPAYAESIFDLSAAASKQDGLYVTVSSAQTPIASYVRTVSTDGLTPKGSEYAVPVNETKGVSYIPSVREGDETELAVYSKNEQDITLAWVGKNGTSGAETHHVNADRVSVIDMGNAPKNALAIQIETDLEVAASATLTRSDGDEGQADFALASVPVMAKSSAVAIPDQSDAELTFVSANDCDVTVTAYDETGGIIDSRDIAVESERATSYAVSEFGDGVAAVSVDDEDGNMTWGVRVGQQSVTDAGLAGLSAIMPEALAMTTELIWANGDPTIVR